MSLSKEEILYFIKRFFENYIYYIAIFLFYLSLYLFIKSFFTEIEISQLFLFFNLVVVWLYFIEHKFSLFHDLLRVNTVIISLYYIFFQLFYILWMRENFIIEDVWNIIILLFLLVFFIIKSQGSKYLATLYTYLLFFLFINALSWMFFLFWEVLLWAWILAFVLQFLFFTQTEALSEISSISKKTIRIWWISFSSLFLYFSVASLWVSDGILFFFCLLLLVSSSFLLLFHTVFQNYFSLIVSLLWYGFSSYGIYMFFVPVILKYTYLSFLCFIISFLYIFISQVIERKYIYDKYFFHSFSLVVNVIWVILFLFFNEISILKLSILIAGESLYLFASYYYFRKSL